jgi:Tfp pilus assembly protein PilZ
VRFRLPGGTVLHDIEGRVVWRRRPEDPGQHAPGMGIEFTDRGAAAKLARELETLS